MKRPSSPLITGAIIFFLLSGTLILPGCFGGDEEVIGDTNEVLPFYRLVEKDDVSIQIPEDWEEITSFSSEYPENTVIAFRNNIQESTFLANINIVKNTVTEGTSSSDYALDVIKTLSGQLINFKKISEEEFTINVGGTDVTSYRIEFEGTNDASKEARHFIQVYGVTGTTAYIVTGAYDENDDELAIDQVKQSIGTFELN